MGMSESFSSSLVGCLIFAVLVQSKDQSGFISIDCGIPAKYTYTEKITGINYISDDKFINSGVSNSITSELKSMRLQQLWNLRSFPQGTRNCYTINITSGSKYLIRANFLYGNYDGLNELPSFDLHLGPSLWETVKITNASLLVSPEIIHVPSLDYMQICLVDTGSGTPFISAIELRTLMNDTYVTQTGSLSLYWRLNLGSTSKRTYRYGYDVYDRYWSYNVYNPGWTQISASISADSLAQNHYEPAAIVMNDAATPVNESAPMLVWWEPENATEQFHVYLHFAELQVLEKNQTRSFTITLNGDLFYANFVPNYKVTTTIFSKYATSGEKIELFFKKTEHSTLPPILNAIEVYTVKEFSQSETEEGDVDAITTIKSFYGVTRNWEGDPCGPEAYIWEGLNCTHDGQSSPRITVLNLSSSGLTGQVDPSISKLTMLEMLDLSNNSLNGPVPDFLSQLQNVKILNLEKNNFTGTVPSDLIEKSKKGSLSLSVGQNPYLCESPPCNKKKKDNIIVPVAASVVGVLILLVAAATILFTLKSREPRGTIPIETSQQVEKVEEQQDMTLQVPNRQYSYSDVIKMTYNFSTILGKGGFGTVYLGYIDETPVAVKMLSPSSVQGYQQFQAEVKLLMRVHHRNLTSLVGYCNEETNKGLIYEYMANGDLQDYLSGKDNKPKFLTWEDRLCIALDAAFGLEYLHNGCKPPIIHRDVKSSNILLNENFRAKIADFGLSKTIPTDGGTHVSTVVAGTPGYLDPEYYITNRLTEKSDVFSFGVVLFEIITSLPVISRNHERTHISQWVSSMVAKGDIKAIVDSKFGGDFDSNSVWRAVELAMTCVSPNPNSRPSMSEAVNELKECLATEVARTKHNDGGHAGDSVELVSLNMTSSEFSPLAR
ncbi:LOW QUALITY PROTEIN: LRR receptor-like serine/threonine-protein kinase IOS1 [Prosopis cineraria]|uniref:LOW QUALITY PROTEIN: LRR receptor-like serine/threonine-protein kinase IOS1 n=1 Tax=Prosopis cineraria TaxID=364024 RepID=UPI00240F5A20|nr:LOW QUALITY PROTEIN: LRR receptor-like serine/threonine-protein kinase IOS1 [Prosopis cineraria]